MKNADCRLPIRPAFFLVSYFPIFVFLRKLTAFILFTSLLVVLSGYHIIFRCQLSKLKAEMKRNIRASRNSRDVVEFVFDKEQAAQLHWEDKHEFRLKGEMYDVIEKTIKDGKLHLRCIADKKEKKLLHDYAKHASKRQQGKWSMTAFFQLNFLISCLQIPSIPVFDINRSFVKYNSALHSRPLSLISPPPRFC